MYRYAVDCGRMRQIADDLMIGAKTSGAVSKCYYEYARTQLKCIAPSCKKNVTLGKR